jgi:hypothetical protein
LDKKQIGLDVRGNECYRKNIKQGRIESAEGMGEKRG